jgi:hypothetical protein
MAPQRPRCVCGGQRHTAIERSRDRLVGACYRRRFMSDEVAIVIAWYHATTAIPDRAPFIRNICLANRLLVSALIHMQKSDAQRSR